MQHTCNQTPNDDGRILPACSGCHETAHGDGLITGTRHTAEDIFDLLTQAVKQQFNPIDLPRRKEAVALWENGRTMLELIDNVRTSVHKANTKALNEHMAATAMTGPAPEPETQETAASEEASPVTA